MAGSKHSSRGNTVIEFTLVGIPLIFTLISIFEIARGMWAYQTLAYAIKEGVRFAIVHGQNCETPPNACQVTVGHIATRIRDAGVGLVPTELEVTLIPVAVPADTVSCQPLSACLGNSNYWPPYPGNQPRLEIEIQGAFPFRSAIAMLWPGAGRGMTFGTYTFRATSRERIQF